jgi:hypothetical protein
MGSNRPILSIASKPRSSLVEVSVSRRIIRTHLGDDERGEFTSEAPSAAGPIRARKTRFCNSKHGGQR